MRAETGTVVVVDDDAAVRRSLRFVLEIEGIAVRLYSGARDLLEGDDLTTAGCYVIDYAMPDMNGVELAEALRQRNVTAPIILIAGKVNAAMRVGADGANVLRVLEKPLSDSLLLDCVRSILRPGDAGPLPM